MEFLGLLFECIMEQDLWGVSLFLDKEVFEKAREFILETESRTVKGADGTEYIYYGILEVKKE